MDERETATSLALVRIGLPLVLLVDLFWAVRLELIDPLWAPSSEGGIGVADTWAQDIPAWHFFGTSATVTHAVFGVVVVSAITLALGLLSRLSAATLLFSYAQLAMMMAQSDRGIDVMFRACLILLACSGAGETLSLDARRKHGRFRTEELVSAWPRYLMIAQLAWMYFSAGTHKTQSAWWPAGDLSALWIIVRDPHFARLDLADAEWLYPFTQLGTLGTMFFELGAPLFVLSLWYRRTADRAGRLRALFNRVRFREIWLGLGVGFHVALVITLRLGIFPVGMLVLYPAFFPPLVIERFAARVAARLRRRSLPRA